MSMDGFTSYFKAYTGDGSEEFNTWLLSIGKLFKLTANDPKDICFTKAEGNFKIYFYSLQLHTFSWNSPNEKMQAGIYYSGHCQSCLINPS